MDPTQLTHAIGAIGGLGTAAYGLVDTTKVSENGGISNKGFSFIDDLIGQAIPAGAAAFTATQQLTPPASNASATNSPSAQSAPSPFSAISLDSVRKTLRANWINGMALGDQKAVAKSLIKLNFNPRTVDHFAALTGVNAQRLAPVAEKIANAAATQLQPAESDALGRFELALTTLLDQAYQRADQRYRNSCKVAAVPVALVLALIGGFAMDGWHNFIYSHDWVKALAAGLLACPLAPIAKDLSSAIQAGAKAAQLFTKP